MGSGRGWLAGNWPSTGGRSQHYCVGLDCGLPMVAFWRHNANAKCLVDDCVDAVHPLFSNDVGYFVSLAFFTSMAYYFFQNFALIVVSLYCRRNSAVFDKMFNFGGSSRPTPTPPPLHASGPITFGMRDAKFHVSDQIPLGRFA